MSSPLVRQTGPFREKAAPRWNWPAMVRNRFWLIVPILGPDLALTGHLPPPLAPHSAAPIIPVWLELGETVLRAAVLGAPLLMPLSLRAPTSRPVFALSLVGLGAYTATWAAQSPGHQRVPGVPASSASRHWRGPQSSCSSASLCSQQCVSSPDTGRGCI
jgi:hypothetical protein